MTSLPWTSELPPSWEIVPARAVLKPVRRDPCPKDETVTAFRDGQVTLRSNRRNDGFTESVKEIGYQGVRRGEVVIHSMDAFAGAIGVSDSDGKMSPVVHIYTAPNDSPEFIVHSLRATSRAGFIRALAKGIRERSTSFDRPVLKSMLLPRPPREEQDQIVAYLDRETQKIDELITEQRGLIETLRERRSAIIDRTALDEMDPLDSRTNGSWPVAALGYGFQVQLGKMLDSGRTRDELARDLPYIRAGNIQDSGLDLSDLNTMPFTVQEAAKFDLRRNDLLVVEGGAIGTSVVLDEDLPEISFQKTVNRLRATRGWNPMYYRYVITAYRDRGILDILANKSTIAHFTAEKLRVLRVPMPSIPEQDKIAAYLDEQTSRIDELISESEDLIALSQERRAALITAAVTGQIDVRTAA